MKRNSKLSLALHTLGHMAAASDRPLTSEVIAGFCRTNPVVVRRVLGKLREAGILSSEKGHAGGWTLARPPAEVSLADVYAALGERFLAPAQDEAEELPPHCVVERAFHAQVEAALDAAEAVLVRQLAGHSIAALAEEFRDPAAAPRPPA